MSLMTATIDYFANSFAMTGLVLHATLAWWMKNLNFDLVGKLRKVVDGLHNDQEKVCELDQ